MTGRLVVIASLVAALTACAPSRPRPPQHPRNEPIVLDNATTPERLELNHPYYVLVGVWRIGRVYEITFPEAPAVRRDVLVVDGIVRTSGRWTMSPDLSTPVPPSLEQESAHVEQTLRTTYRTSKRMSVRYRGEYRRMVIQEIIVRRADPVPVGTIDMYELLANAELTRVEGLIESYSGGYDGPIAKFTAGGGARIDDAGPSDLYERALAVARDVVAHKPVPGLDALLRAPVSAR